MSQSAQSLPPLPGQKHTFLGHPAGLFLLFFVEMWERFSYYGMRGLLVLYLTSPTTGMRVLPAGRPEGFNPGRGWTDPEAYTAYGWYTSLCYLVTIGGGLIADKLIGTHRSMVTGGIIISLGHIMLGLSGFGDLAHNSLGMSIFVFGLALVIVGTGHFKPSATVMVGQLYRPDDPRREGAFGIFYMGINLGSALQAYVVGSLGELFGWHYGFSAAAGFMITGIIGYMLLRPILLAGVGEPPADGRPRTAYFLPLFAIGISAVAAYAFHVGWLREFDSFVSQPKVHWPIIGGATLWAIYFIAKQAPGDKGPVASIFLFMLFNAIFWMSFEQAGSSINVFTDRFTDRAVGAGLGTFGMRDIPSMVAWLIAAAGIVVFALGAWKFRPRPGGSSPGSMFYGLLLVIVGLCAAGLAITRLVVSPKALVPTTSFQSINPWLIVAFAPVFGALWTSLARQKKQLSQPAKIGLGVLLVGLGYLFLVFAALQLKTPGAKANMMFVVGTYFVHTVGEIILSPTGLTYVTRAAPKKSASLLMGVWFVSSVIANLAAGKIAALVDPIIKGETKLPWDLGEPQANFFLFFVITSCSVGLLVIVTVPLLKKLMRHADD